MKTHYMIAFINKKLNVVKCNRYKHGYSQMAAFLVFKRVQRLVFDLWCSDFVQGHCTDHANRCKKTSNDEHQVQTQGGRWRERKALF